MNREAIAKELVRIAKGLVSDWSSTGGGYVGRQGVSEALALREKIRDAEDMVRSRLKGLSMEAFLPGEDSIFDYPRESLMKLKKAETRLDLLHKAIELLDRYERG